MINVIFPPSFSIFSLADFEIELTSISNFCFISPSPSNFNFLYFLLINWDFCKLTKFIKKKYRKLKLLGVGDLKQKFDIEVNSISKSAKEKIEKLGGKVTLIK